MSNFTKKKKKKPCILGVKGTNTPIEQNHGIGAERVNYLMMLHPVKG